MKILLTLSVLLSLFLSNFAQITFTSVDMPVAGWSQKIRKDNLPLPTINFGNKGANQVYNFGNLVWDVQDTIEYKTPTSTQLANVPNADVAVTTDGTSFLFTQTTAAKQSLLGFEGPFSGSILSAAYQTSPDIFKFSTQYQGAYSGNYSLIKTVAGSAVGQPSIYQVRLTVTGNYTDSVDGWGKIITPVGAYKCLRIKRIDASNTLIEFKACNSVICPWTTAPGYPLSASTVRYTYPTKETKGSVVNFDYDSVNNVTAASYSLIPPNAPIANFSFVVGSGGSVAFTDLSDNYPTSWSWNFGDGSALSTQQNPTHVFAANGNYNICLVATNAGGSSTSVCKQVNVTGIAVTPVAAFAWSNTSGGLVNFTDQSTNTPNTWAWTFGDAGTSTTQNPTHVYAANGAYYVCLTATNGAGSNMHCDSVHVSQVSAGNHAPVATDDTASATQPDGLVRNVVNNDTDPDGDNICIDSVYGSPAFSIAATGNCTSVLYTPDSTFTGSDTCWYIICDNGSPVLCDTGMFVVNSIANDSLLPVASFSDQSFYFCIDFSATNTSLRYDSLVWNLHSLPVGAVYPDTTLINQELVLLNLMFATEQVCLTAYNKFGSSTFCDTVFLDCEGIHEISLSGIQLYPNPTNNIITIDMTLNQEEATRNYSAIEIYNALGERVKLVGEIANKGSKLVNISLAELTGGMYQATLLDSKGTRRSLGRFVVQK